MPDLHLVWACRQLIDDEFSMLVTNREICSPGNHDDSAHPCMEHIAVDSDETDSIQPFRHLAPCRQADVEQSLFAQARVDGVKNRIAVLKQQVAADRGYLDMRREGALLIVEDQLHGLRGNLSVERVERNNSVSQSTVSSDEQSFIRHLGAAQCPVFENRQRLRTLMIPRDAHRAAYGLHPPGNSFTGSGSLEFAGCRIDRAGRHKGKNKNNC